MVDVDVDSAILQGFEEGISVSLGYIPVAGPFLQAIFGHIWDIAFASRTAEANKKAMDTLFEAIEQKIQQALAENVADQARAYNASAAQLGLEYRLSVDAFKESGSQGDKVVVRFENLKALLVLMLNLFSQPTYMKHTVLSYGSALSMYVGLLREMALAGKDCGYSDSEISQLGKDIDARVLSSYQQVMYDAVCKLVKEAGEFRYPSLASVVMNLGKLTGGMMNFQTEWHDGIPCLKAQPHPDYFDCDLVDRKARYVLGFWGKAGASKNYYHMPQVFVSGRPALHVYTDVGQSIQVARFATDETMDVKLRAYYLVDYDDYDSRDIQVTLSTYNNPKVHEFHCNQPRRSIVSLPWVKMYYSNTDGGPWSTHYDKFSTNMRMQYDEYGAFKAEEAISYYVNIKSGSSATTNYYYIAFEAVPVV